MIKKKYILIEPITLHQLVDDREQKKNRFDRERGTLFFLPSIKLSSTFFFRFLFFFRDGAWLRSVMWCVVVLFVVNGALLSLSIQIKYR